MSSDLLHRTCPVCKSPESKPSLRKDALQLVQCSACEMIFANPVPTEMGSGAFYDDANSYYLSEAKLKSDYAPVRFERELRHFRQFVKTGRVLDVGCSTGAFLYQLRDRFSEQYEILGTDVAGPALDFAESKKIPIQRGDFLKMDFQEQFDAITFWAVLEHLLNPAAFLEKAATLLRPGGYCFILAPNFRSLATRILGRKYRYILPQHLNYFTPTTLAALTTKYFAPIDLTTTHFNPAVILQDLRSKPTSDENRAELLQRTTSLKQNPILAPARVAYRATESVLSRMMLADNLLFIGRSKSRSSI
jgi:2-polyprenyl-3-methyl-5-hydroxy-6-metoxy-1,4-benzoquinol methylase